MGSQANDSQATTVFVLGLLGLIACQALGPLAWYMGNQYMEACRVEGVEPNGMGVAGRMLGIVGSVMLLVTALILLLYFGCVFGYIFLVIFLAMLGALA